MKIGPDVCVGGGEREGREGVCVCVCDMFALHCFVDKATIVWANPGMFVLSFPLQLFSH